MKFSLQKKAINLIVMQIMITIFVLIIWLLDVYTIEMIRLIFLISLIVVVLYSLICVRFPSMFHWFVIVYISLYYLYPLFIPIFLPEINIDNSIMLSYTFVVVCGLHLFVISYEVFKNKKSTLPVSNSVKISSRKLENVVIIFLLINILTIGIFVWDAGSLSEIINATRLQRKVQTTSLTILGIYLVNIGSILYLVTPIYLSENKKFAIPLISLLIVFDIIIFFVFRQRTPLIMHIIALGIGFYYVKPMLTFSKFWEVRNYFKVNYIKIGLLFIFLVLLATNLRFFRGQMESRGITEVNVRVDESLLHSLTYGDLGYTPRIISILNTVPEKQDYLYGQSYYRVLFLPIPRTIWKNKPENTQRIVASWLYPGKLEQTSPPGIQGDLYINFGFWGLSGFMIYGLIFAKLDYRNTIFKYAIFALSFTQIFHFVRGGFTNPIIVFIILYIITKQVIEYIKRK